MPARTPEQTFQQARLEIERVDMNGNPAARNQDMRAGKSPFFPSGKAALRADIA